MYEDDIFEEEVDQEAARERAAQNAQQNGQSQQGSNQNEQWQRQQYQYQQFYSQYDPNKGPYYGQGAYGPRGYNRTPSGKKFGNGPAIASLVLGIISLVFFFSFFNVISAILGLIFGIVFLTKYEYPSGKGLAIAGIVTSALSIIALVASVAYIVSNVNLIRLYDDDSLFEYYYEYSLPEANPFSDEFLEDDSLPEEFLFRGSDEAL